MILVPFFEIPYREKLAKNVNSQYVQVISPQLNKIEILISVQSRLFNLGMPQDMLQFEGIPCPLSFSFYVNQSFSAPHGTIYEKNIKKRINELLSN